MEEMTPRERVLLALSHQETDRVPVDLIATREAWDRLKKHLGIYDTAQLQRYLGLDLRHPNQPYIGPPLPRHADGIWTDVWGIGRQPVAHQGGVYDEMVAHPLAQAKSAEQLADYRWPQPDWWDAAALAGQIAALDAERPYAIALEEFGDPGGMFEIAWYLRGMEQFLTDLIERPELAYEIMRHVTDYFVGKLERVMAAAGNRIDLIWTSDDVAHQHGLLISQRTWRELIAPHHARLNQRVHELGARVMYHCCGAVRPLVPHLISIGVDVLDVLQFSADGMDPRELKATFGPHLCFHGGMDVQTTLPFGSEEEVRSVTRQRIELLGGHGGYILAPTHNVQVDTPPQNIVAMYTEAGSAKPV